MLEISWATNETVQDPGGGDIQSLTFGVLELDIVESDSYDVSSTLTSHAVEEGIPVSDNSDLHPDRYSVTVYVSDRPASLNLVDGTTRAAIELANGQSASAITPPTGTTRTADAFDTLRELIRNATLVDVAGARRELEGWVLESMSAPRTTDDAGVLVCSLNFVEYRTVVFQDVDAPSPRVARGRRQNNQGTQTPATDGDETATASTDPRLRSIADRGLSGILERITGS